MPPWAQAHSPAPSHPPTKHAPGHGRAKPLSRRDRAGTVQNPGRVSHRATEEGENWRWSDVEPFDNDHFVNASKAPGTGLSPCQLRDPKSHPGPWGGFLSSVSRVCSRGRVQRAGAK